MITKADYEKGIMEYFFLVERLQECAIKVNCEKASQVIRSLMKRQAHKNRVMDEYLRSKRTAHES